VIIETSGNPIITSFCIDKIADGGRMVVVGQSGPGAPIQINNPGEFFGTKGKTIKSTQGGGTSPSLDIPQYINLYDSGKINFVDLISHTFELEDIERAFTTLKSGIATRIMLQIQEE
jgi:Zn-dependent alcohol dehydrogenase